MLKAAIDGMCCSNSWSRIRADRKQTDRRVDQQDPSEAEGPLLVIQLGDERRFRRAQAVADEIVASDRDLVFEIAADQRHHPVDVLCVLGEQPRPARGRGRDDEIRMQGRGQGNHMDLARYSALCKIRLLPESKPCAGAGDDECEPRRPRLRRERIAQGGRIPEHVRHLAAAQHEQLPRLARNLRGQVSLVFLRRADHRRDKGIAERIAIVGDDLAQRRRSHQQGAQQHGREQGSHFPNPS